MPTINVYQVKTRLSYYLGLVQKGKRIVISKRNVPIAELLPIRKDSSKRALGRCDEPFEVPDDFFKPLPKSIVKAFTHPR